MKKMASSSYRREMEMLHGAINQMAQENETSTAVVVAYLNRCIENIRKSGMFPDNFSKEMLLMQKKYTISLKVDFDDEKRYGLVLHMMRKAARQLLTQATLIQDSRPPQVAFESEDFFEGGTIEGLQDIGDSVEDPVIKDPPAEPEAEKDDEQAGSNSTSIP